MGYLREIPHRFLRCFGRGVFHLATRATVLHADRSRQQGGFLLASNHECPLDILVLERSCHRLMEWLSIPEVMGRPILGRFARAMGAFAVDRSTRDAVGTRVLLERLKAGRVIGFFPEGRIPRRSEESMLHGAAPKAGIGGIAHMAGVPVVPAVLRDSRSLQGVTAWLPLRSARYGLIFGEPLWADPDLDRKAAAQDLEQRLAQAMTDLHAELLASYSPKYGAPWER